MTTSDHPGRRTPRKRSGSTRPPSTGASGRRARDRRPWPTAPTTTRPSPGKPADATRRSQKNGRASTSTPATVWPAGPSPIDLDATWPVALIDRVVTAFSTPGARVVLLPWPSPQGPHPALTPVAPDGVIDRAPDTDPDPEITDALHAVERLGRTAHIARVPHPTATDTPASAPFWADLIEGTSPAPTTSAAALNDAVLEEETQSSGGDDLIISGLRPELSGDRTADLIALFAARRLRVGGILVVLTHCDWTTGQLIDPTGTVVAAGQNADLLYLQHIVAVHTPVRDGRFNLPHKHPDRTGNSARTCHRARVRGLPLPHERIHSDVLVFTQPHDHQPQADDT
ncbi:hypothetical protein [Amycolatopsis sacchari]|uniref:hypothetical protein n=1 Tax=Amycolatopsis sacchari TaxID=115433 RepID=UPI003D73F7C1